MLTRNSSVTESVESVLSSEGSLWWERLSVNRKIIQLLSFSDNVNVSKQKFTARVQHDVHVMGVMWGCNGTTQDCQLCLNSDTPLSQFSHLCHQVANFK